MDQTFVAGLGNIYVNEVLFLSKIHPQKLCNKLSSKDINNLINSIKKVLKQSIKLGGSSIKNYMNPLDFNNILLEKIIIQKVIMHYY